MRLGESQDGPLDGGYGRTFLSDTADPPIGSTASEKPNPPLPAEKQFDCTDGGPQFEVAPRRGW